MSADDLLNADLDALEGLDIDMILDEIDEDNLEDKEHGSPIHTHTLVTYTKY